MVQNFYKKDIKPKPNKISKKNIKKVNRKGYKQKHSTKIEMPKK